MTDMRTRAEATFDLLYPFFVNWKGDFEGVVVHLLNEEFNKMRAAVLAESILDKTQDTKEPEPTMLNKFGLAKEVEDGDFAFALHHLKAGKCVRRALWNHRGSSGSNIFDHLRYYDFDGVIYGKSENDKAVTFPYIFSHDDILAEDWMIV